jgi:hypothetical protein
VGTPDGYAGMLIGAEHLCGNPDADLRLVSEFDQMVIFDLKEVFLRFLYSNSFIIQSGHKIAFQWACRI